MASLYTLVPAGWPRYAFEPYSLGLALSGGFPDRCRHMAPSRGGAVRTRGKGPDLVEGPGSHPAGSHARRRSRWLDRAARATVLRAGPESQRFADYLRRNVGPRAVVESWEWEIDTLADLNYHHPTNDWVDAYTALLQFGEPLPRRDDPFQYSPDY